MKEEFLVWTSCAQLIKRRKKIFKVKSRIEKCEIIKMSDEKGDLKSIKVYKFNNTEENWHEFALKFGVIADSRGYDGIIDGTVTPPDEKEKLRYLQMIRDMY